MPLVRIDAIGTGKLEALGDAVHDALVETLGIPADDRFQVLNGQSILKYDDYLGIHRDEGVVFVGITMRPGRTDEQKKSLYRRITELAEEYSGTEPRNMLVTITETDAVNWSIGNGEAQYA
ncbi:tautomerase family protein [Amycolatopsis sp. WAC 04182]|uniref:tautomerase family protein n=1 Tax=Amycolatopsis sp. WAC 04182 TaxID=2203198 RepID=UPI000F798ECD|nr:tautomerase family protein [Amycolatopsis sp. WAC 04182]RSN55998.1 tautomerase family protein [Amycolatopsis sp. WAC 04182]